MSKPVEINQRAQNSSQGAQSSVIQPSQPTQSSHVHNTRSNASPAKNTRGKTLGVKRRVMKK